MVSDGGFQVVPGRVSKLTASCDDAGGRVKVAVSVYPDDPAPVPPHPIQGTVRLHLLTCLLLVIVSSSLAEEHVQVCFQWL